MIRCSKCVMPDTRPDTEFVDGVCSACITYANRPTVDWEARQKQLIDILDAHDGRCIVPSSGGKDSTYQVVKLLDLGADVTVVTATTCHLTRTGRANIDNLAKLARTIEVTPNRRARADLNWAGLELVGDISWPEHVSIFTTPFRMAKALDIPLIFYGENPQAEYGGPIGKDQALQMTARWRSEFGGFLGLRPADLADTGYRALSKTDMADYLLPEETNAEAYFLGQFFKWDSHHNEATAYAWGMRGAKPSDANYWDLENLDNAQTGLHDHMMYRKYGYGRGCAQISVDIRNGLITRENALRWVRKHDGLFPFVYAGVPIEEMLERIGMSMEELLPILDRFTNWALFEGQNNMRPRLKE
jgi:N-acetyl sugar amidotransferase